MDKTRAAAAYRDPAVLALAEWQIDPRDLELVAVAENVTFRVHADDDYVLRLHRPGYHDFEELISERVWIRALAAAGLDVPIPIPAADGREYVLTPVEATGEQRYAGLTRWVDGQPIREILAQRNDPAQTTAHFEQIGATAAAIHNQSSGWPVPSDFKRHHLDADGFMGPAPFWGPFWEMQALSRAQKALFLTTRAKIHRSLSAYGKDPTTYSLIHADLHAGNLLLHGERVHVIDFDDAGFGWHPYELAVALFDRRSAPEFEDLLNAITRGYRRVRAISDQTLALIPMFLLIRGLASLGWIDARPELDHDRNRLSALCEELAAECESFLSEP